jgi:hypothetical protein
VNDPVRGTVLNLNRYGGTVRLDDGRIAGILVADLEANRHQYERAWTGRKNVEFILRTVDRRLTAVLAPQIVDGALEEQIAQYLKSAPPANERRFLQKKRRAAFFESRHSNER